MRRSSGSGAARRSVFVLAASCGDARELTRRDTPNRGWYCNRTQGGPSLTSSTTFSFFSFFFGLVLFIRRAGCYGALGRVERWGGVAAGVVGVT